MEMCVHLSLDRRYNDMDFLVVIVFGVVENVYSKHG